MDKNKIKEMVKSALSKPMSEKINSKEYISNRKQVKEAQSSSTGFLIKKVEEVMDAISTLHRNTSTNSEIPTTSKGGLLRAFDELSDMLEVIASNVEREGLDENMLDEAYVPDNIKKFAKERGVSSLVSKAAGWAEKVGKRITGGTAIGKNYSTLILDMGYQTGDIRINTEDETIELYGEEVNSFPEFKKVYMDENSEDKIEENIQDDDVLGDMISDMLKYKTKEEVLQYLRQQVALHYDDVKDSKPKIPKGKMEEGMGNEVGDVVYFKGNLGEKYPASQGYYGIIEDVTPASNYNMLATYQVVVCDENDDEVGIVNTSFLNLSSKLKISTPKLKSMAETIMSKLKGKNMVGDSVTYNNELHDVVRVEDDKIYIRPSASSHILGKKNIFWVKKSDLND
jgi:hypothetical protein